MKAGEWLGKVAAGALLLSLPFLIAGWLVPWWRIEGPFFGVLYGPVQWLLWGFSFFSVGLSDGLPQGIFSLFGGFLAVAAFLLYLAGTLGAVWMIYHVLRRENPEISDESFKYIVGGLFFAMVLSAVSAFTGFIPREELASLVNVEPELGLVLGFISFLLVLGPSVYYYLT